MVDEGEKEDKGIFGKCCARKQKNTFWVFVKLPFRSSPSGLVALAFCIVFSSLVDLRLRVLEYSKYSVLLQYYGTVVLEYLYLLLCTVQYYSSTRILEYCTRTQYSSR
jgi:hypothetical protein